jgi:hypothetical protein
MRYQLTGVDGVAMPGLHAYTTPLLLGHRPGHVAVAPLGPTLQTS